jgi:hypothetical protein
MVTVPDEIRWKGAALFTTRALTSAKASRTRFGAQELANACLGTANRQVAIDPDSDCLSR